MKVIFLDIDGVVNSGPFLDSHQSMIPSRQKHHDERAECNRLVELAQCDGWAHDLQPSRVALLTELVKRTGAKVVISSSWRHNKSDEAIAGALRCFGFNGEVIGHTPYGGHLLTRGGEILAWLAEHQGEYDIESFVVLDDDPKTGLDEVARHLVLTHFEVGLTRAHIEAAEKVLER